MEDHKLEHGSPNKSKYKKEEIIIQPNELFIKCYKNIINDEKEWNDFYNIICTKLPCTFRISNILKLQKSVLDHLNKYYSNIIKNAIKLKWYPNENAWQINLSKKELKHTEDYNIFHKFLINETLFGSLSRQETVSIIPPILLDIQSNHSILDMCASPGSKTSQILEYLFTNSIIPDGFVVANDMSINRCFTLITQLKRIDCPCIIVTCHDARHYPVLYKSNQDSISYLQFDRILCDVPCSGDGTVRKNPSVCKRWNYKTGFNLHFMQKDILKRGLELLKIGGILVYSTCSMNPIENEAVIFNILNKYNGCIKCIDVSHKLPGLKYSKGIRDYSFVLNEVQLNNKQQIDVPNEEEYYLYGLNNTIRIYPHYQNTGGFFIAVLCKYEEITKHNDSKTNINLFQDKSKFKITKKSFISSLNENDNEWINLNSFYGLQNILPRNLICRSENHSKNTLYYINDQLYDFLHHNKNNLRIIGCGSKLFTTSSFKNNTETCSYRVVQEAISLFHVNITKRVLTITSHDFQLLLSNEDVPFNELDTPIVNILQGSIVFHYFSDESYYIVGHIGINRARFMINQVDRIHFLSIINNNILKAIELSSIVKSKQNHSQVTK